MSKSQAHIELEKKIAQLATLVVSYAQHHQDSEATQVIDDAFKEVADADLAQQIYNKIFPAKPTKSQDLGDEGMRPSSDVAWFLDHCDRVCQTTCAADNRQGHKAIFSYLSDVVSYCFLHLERGDAAGYDACGKLLQEAFAQLNVLLSKKENPEDLLQLTFNGAPFEFAGQTQKASGLTRSGGLAMFAGGKFSSLGRAVQRSVFPDGQFDPIKEVIAKATLEAKAALAQATQGLAMSRAAASASPDTASQLAAVRVENAKLRKIVLGLQDKVKELHSQSAEQQADLFIFMQRNNALESVVANHPELANELAAAMQVIAGQAGNDDDYVEQQHTAVKSPRALGVDAADNDNDNDDVIEDDTQSDVTAKQRRVEQRQRDESAGTATSSSVTTPVRLSGKGSVSGGRQDCDFLGALLSEPCANDNQANIVNSAAAVSTTNTVNNSAGAAANRRHGGNKRMV